MIDLPRGFRHALDAAVAVGPPPRAEALRRHYLERMPQQRAQQLRHPIFAAPLRWERLPRLSAALDRMFALLPDGVTLLGCATAAELRARPLTVGALYAETYYGGFMPLLYGTAADLAHFGRAAERDGVDAAIDLYLAAPIIHELTHLSRDRPIVSLYVDECVAAWLGVRVLREFAFPRDGEDNALYATPWLAQVGQALARVAGAEALVAAHAGARPWREALPRGLADALARLAAADDGAMRSMHLLSDSVKPARWMKLACLAAAGAPLDELTLPMLEALPFGDVPAGDETPMDGEILDDALAAMCLRNFQVGGSFRVEMRAPPAPVAIDLRECRVSTAAGGDGFDPAPPAYLFPPATAARLRARGIGGYVVEFRNERSFRNSLAAVARAVREGAGAHDGDGYALARR